MSKEYKSFPGLVTKADQDQGIVEAYFSIFGVLDDGNDIVHPGAFAKTFSERGHKVKVLDSHNARSISDVIGKALVLKEVEEDKLPSQLKKEYPEASGGAYAKVKMLMDTPEGRGAFVRLKEGAVDEWSFAYDALDVNYEEMTRDGEKVNTRHLRTIKLYEISPTIFGMNPATTTTSAKAKEGKPWDVFTEDDEYCVYRVNEDGDPLGDSVGCHPSEEDALDQVAALYANVEEEMGKAVNLSEMLQDIRVAFDDVFNPEDSVEYWVRDIFDEYVIVEHNSDQGVVHFRINYEEVDGGYSFAPRSEWVEGEFIFNPKTKGATGKTTWPLADRKRPWDADTATGRLRRWAGGPDKEDMDWSKYKQVHFWVDGDDDENFTAYKLPFCDVINGEVKAVPRGVFAVAGVLSGARDLDITDESAVENKVETYYQKMQDEFDDDSLIAPWNKTKMKEGRVLSQANAERLIDALLTVMELVEEAGYDIPGWGREPELIEPEEMSKSISLDKFVSAVREAFYYSYDREEYIVTGVYEDHIIARGDGEAYYRVSFEKVDEGYRFVPRAEWIEGELTFSPKTSPQGGAEDNTGQEQAGPRDAPTYSDLEQRLRIDKSELELLMEE